MPSGRHGGCRSGGRSPYGPGRPARWRTRNESVRVADRAEAFAATICSR
jgi:hypothetical protein